MQPVPLMNDTKWDELRLSMHSVDPRPRWRTRDIESGYESDWDGDWFHHFRIGGYATIQWVEIRTNSAAHREVVLRRLQEVHVPGMATEQGFLVLGYSQVGESVDYL